MYKDLIKNNINKLSPSIIKEYGKTINIVLNDSESNILYQFIMKNYSEILEGNENSFQELKKELNPTLYQKVFNLYLDVKSKYYDS